jgi:hypothetical protein
MTGKFASVHYIPAVDDLYPAFDSLVSPGRGGDA